MATPSNPNFVRVPKPASGSFNKERPLKGNALLKNQVDHFHELEKRLLADLQTGIQYETVSTEGQAAEYIRKMTTILHPRVFRSTAK
jgi:hypothetical protein